MLGLGYVYKRLPYLVQWKEYKTYPISTDVLENTGCVVSFISYKLTSVLLEHCVRKIFETIRTTQNMLIVLHRVQKAGN